MLEVFIFVWNQNHINFLTFRDNAFNNKPPKTNGVFFYAMLICITINYYRKEVLPERDRLETCIWC